jgi:hypothetical protein
MWIWTEQYSASVCSNSTSTAPARRSVLELVEVPAVLNVLDDRGRLELYLRRVASAEGRRLAPVVINSSRASPGTVHGVHKDHRKCLDCLEAARACRQTRRRGAFRLVRSRRTLAYRGRTFGKRRNGEHVGT